MGAEYTINTYFTHPWVFNSSSDGITTLLAKASVTRALAAIAMLTGLLEETKRNVTKAPKKIRTK